MYALGVLGYELYTGEGPYEAKTNIQWITAHLSGDLRNLPQLRPDIDPNVADLLTRCLNREPNHRPSAARAISILKGDEDASATMSGSVDKASTLDSLLKRRIPQFIGGSVAAGVGFVGLVGMLEDQQLEDILEIARGDPEDTVQALLDAANEAGGSDNITAVLLTVSSSPDG